jgi:hypothetical protein
MLPRASGGMGGACIGIEIVLLNASSTGRGIWRVQRQGRASYCEK